MKGAAKFKDLKRKKKKKKESYQNFGEANMTLSH